MSRFDVIENPGSYLAAQRHDWYAIENLIAYGECPANQVSCKEVEPATRERPGSVISTDWSGTDMRTVAHESPVMQHDPERGAA